MDSYLACIMHKLRSVRPSTLIEIICLRDGDEDLILHER